MSVTDEHKDTRPVQLNDGILRLGTRPKEVPAYTPDADPKLGRKTDGGKLRWTLVPMSAMKDVVKVLTIGAQKYAPDNWRFVKGACGSQGRYADAAFRHLTAWQEGEQNDPETGCNHLSHCICCLLFLIWFDFHPEQQPPEK
jgi:hypothetical protein